MTELADGTRVGCAAFLRPDVNKHIQKLLGTWAKLLASRDSIIVLSAGHGGWLSSQALSAMKQVVNTACTTRSFTFAEAYICDPNTLAHGYCSWDAFSTWRFRPGIRPVGSPDNPRLIASVCEFCPYRIAYKVLPRAQFSIKEQPYSLLDMLNDDPLAPLFSHGVVYQAFLSAFSYYRWHAPVTGTIFNIVHIAGTYYLQNQNTGFANTDPHTSTSAPDTAAPNTSQAYLCQVATRALIFIQADDERIGLVVVLLVGMTEVSSCEVFVKQGQRVRKGEEIGTFHYGGSTHCLIFHPEVKLRFVPTEPFGQTNVPVCSTVAELLD